MEDLRVKKKGSFVNSDRVTGSCVSVRVLRLYTCSFLFFKLTFEVEFLSINEREVKLGFSDIRNAFTFEPAQHHNFFGGLRKIAT